MTDIIDGLEALLSFEPEEAAKVALRLHGPELDEQHTIEWAAMVGIVVTEHQRDVAEIKESLAGADPELEKSYIAYYKVTAVKAMFSMLRMAADASPSEQVH